MGWESAWSTPSLAFGQVLGAGVVARCDCIGSANWAPVSPLFRLHIASLVYFCSLWQFSRAVPFCVRSIAGLPRAGWKDTDTGTDTVTHDALGLYVCCLHMRCALRLTKCFDLLVVGQHRCGDCIVVSPTNVGWVFSRRNCLGNATAATPNATTLQRLDLSETQLNNSEAVNG